jgi:uncharacterized lipoprotein YbaY
MTLFRSIASVLVLAVGLMLSACHFFSHKPRPAGPAVTGTVVYITNVQLPADAVIELKLVEINRDGQTVRVVTEDTLLRPRKIPLEYSLPYNKRDINTRAHYGVDGKIRAGGRVILATPRPTPVLTHGNPRQAEVVLEPVR